MPVTIKPDHKAITAYHQTLEEIREGQDAHTEGNLRAAFGALVRETARERKWTLVEELAQKSRTGGSIRLDGALRDEWQLPHGYWEAKDTHDDLETEIRKKRDLGYPFDNIIFEDTHRAILFQDDQEAARADLRRREDVASLLTRFLNYEIVPFSRFDEAVAYFQQEIPAIATGLKQRIEAAHQSNRAFQNTYAAFMELCQTALNPNLSRAAVDEMLIQHMLTERLIRRVFDVEEFTRRNVIAAEVEKVIDSLTGSYFNRREFLGALDRFYTAIEDAADRLADFSGKQHFINTVYERFFQGYSVKLADTHGIVYTPQEIVDFMGAAVEEVLHDDFGLKLGDEGVYVIDPCTGTGNFMVNLLRRVAEHNPRGLERFYRQQAFANEVMLMPYYIASLNIEHAYYELAGTYEPFEGICFVDTLDLAEGPQMRFSFMTEKNTARVERQKAAPITVIIGNPPYNVGQLNENDNNKNRKYEVIDQHVSKTYARDSKATNKTALSDPYVKFFRWAADRLQGRDGVVCYVSNNSFVDQIAFDGMRKHLLQDFTCIYHLDLHGNVRQNPKLSGTTHNVFGIQVGVGITVAVRKSSPHPPTPSPLHGEGEGGSPHPPALSPLHGEGEDGSPHPQDYPHPPTPSPLHREGEDGSPHPLAQDYPHPLAPAPLHGEGEGGSPHPQDYPHPPTPSPLHGEGEGGGVKEGVPFAAVYTEAELWEKLKPLARQMRQEPTPAEETLWAALRNRQVADFKFRRQHPIDRFIVDFFCAEAHLVVEVDGAIHDYTPDEDALRQAYLESLGLRVLRFRNEAVLNHLAEILTTIETALTRPTPLTPPLHAMERGPGGEDVTERGPGGEDVTKSGPAGADKARLFYHRVPEFWRRGEKLAYLADNVLARGRHNALNTIEWQELTPDARHTWLVAEHADEFTAFLPIGSKKTKALKGGEAEAIFKTFSLGVKTNRDDVVYDFNHPELVKRVGQFIENYNAEVDRYNRAGRPKDIDNFVKYDNIKWSRDLKLDLRRGNYAKYDGAKIRASLYRPFNKLSLFFDRILNQDINLLPSIFPDFNSEQENKIIAITAIGSEKPFMVLMSDLIPDFHLVGAGSTTQCFPFYVYNEDGTNRRENITDWALAQFRARYGGLGSQPSLTPQPNIILTPQPPLHYMERGSEAEQGEDEITKWDIFYYVYALLHHPVYRERYADNLKRELPRLPFAPDFWAFSRAGKALAELHLNYETGPAYALEWDVKKQPVSYRVEKMRLNKDKTALAVNDTLTLTGIPPEAFAYRLGNRSALEWVIDQYQVKRSSPPRHAMAQGPGGEDVISDPNAYSDNPRYIVELVERVVHVSVATVKIVEEVARLALS